jgi:hypothetical protein
MVPKDPASDSDTHTLRFSLLVNYTVQVHHLSQLASVTWLNGTSSWIFYRDPDGQLRKVGRHDYRD